MEWEKEVKIRRRSLTGFTDKDLREIEKLKGKKGTS